MTTEGQDRPGNEALKEFRGPEPKAGEDPIVSPPVTDDDGSPAPVVQNTDDQQPVRKAEDAKDQPPPAPKLSPFDANRARIAERFAKKRSGEFVDTDQDYTKPENVYGKLSGDGAPSADDGGGDAPGQDGDTDKAPAKPGPSDSQEPAKPETMTLVVNGKTVSKTLDEIAALSELSIDEVKADPKRATKYAQRELATSENLNEAKKLRRDPPARQQDDADPGSARPAPHQERQEAGADADQQPVSRHTSVEEVAKLIEDIQIGDPKEVAPKLASLLESVARETSSATAQETESGRRATAELQSNVMVVKEFIDAHPELNGEKPIVAAAIKSGLDQEYRTDLRRALIAEGEAADESEANAIISQATPDQIRNAHLRRRMNGDPNVRKIDKAMMDGVYSRVRADLGVTAAPNQQQGLSREQRKQELQPQPRRASVPQATPNQQPNQPISRKVAVAEMASRTGRKAPSLAR